MTSTSRPLCFCFIMLTVACSSSPESSGSPEQSQDNQDVLAGDSTAESTNSDIWTADADAEDPSDTSAAVEPGPADSGAHDHGQLEGADMLGGDEDAGDATSDGDMCPTAVIQVEEGEQVLVQTLLHLSAAESSAVGGEVSAYEWSVEQPDGSVSIFYPNANMANPTFEVNVVGSYVFRLNVWDEKNVKSCEIATYSMEVTAGIGIHVELLWRTPGDEDESDVGPGAGADLDLHFTHPSSQGIDLDGDEAPDGWFDQPYDCFWMNPNPNWGALAEGIEDDPSLDRDDTDGAGPENLNLLDPEDSTTYGIGVHYWNDHDFGVSHATIKVYVDGLLVWNNPVEAEMYDGGFWDVGTLHWATGVVTPSTGEDGGMLIYATTPSLASEDSW